MKELMLKETEGSVGRLSLQHPNAKPGKQGNVYNYKIVNIPDDISAGEVLNKADGTVFLNAKFDGTGRWVYDYQELEYGRIIRS